MNLHTFVYILQFPHYLYILYIDIILIAVIPLFLFSWKREGNINKVGRDWIKWPSYLDLIVAWFNFKTAIVKFQLKRYIFFTMRIRGIKSTPKAPCSVSSNPFPFIKLEFSKTYKEAVTCFAARSSSFPYRVNIFKYNV